MVRLISQVIILLFASNSMAANFEYDLDCEFFFNGNILMMTVKTDSQKENQVGDISDVVFQRTPKTIPNVNEELGEGELFHFTLDENQEKNIFVQVETLLFQKNVENVFHAKVTNPNIPFLNVFEGYCKRTLKGENPLNQSDGEAETPVKNGSKNGVKKNLLLQTIWPEKIKFLR